MKRYLFCFLFFCLIFGTTSYADYQAPPVPTEEDTIIVTADLRYAAIGIWTSTTGTKYACFRLNSSAAIGSPANVSSFKDYSSFYSYVINSLLLRANLLDENGTHTINDIVKIYWAGTPAQGYGGDGEKQNFSVSKVGSSISYPLSDYQLASLSYRIYTDDFNTYLEMPRNSLTDITDYILNPDYVFFIVNSSYYGNGYSQFAWASPFRIYAEIRVANPFKELNTNIKDGFDQVHRDLTRLDDDVNSGFSQVHDDLTRLDDDVNSGFDSVNETLNKNAQQAHLDSLAVQSDIRAQTAQDKEFRDSDISSAQGLESQLTGFTSQWQTDIKSKWKILFYPIQFITSVKDALTGAGNMRVYNMYITGYHYNDETGGLEPIYDFSRPRYSTLAQARSSTPVIEFPSFTLPVLNVKLWDAYSFDLGTIKDSFPVLFDAINVVFGIVEFLSFVSYLLGKYHAIFD